jgi:phosphoglycerate dehydrogenase-like enzyme
VGKSEPGTGIRGAREEDQADIRSQREAIRLDLLLLPFDVFCTVRERMSLPRSLFQRLPKLKLVTIIGMSLPNLDMAAATDNGVIVAHSNFANPIYANVFNATPEPTWALMIATVRHTDLESRRMREGKWQSTVGIILAGRTLELLGLGRIGKRMAAYAHDFGMPVIAWSQNLTDEAARESELRSRPRRYTRAVCALPRRRTSNLRLVGG